MNRLLVSHEVPKSLLEESRKFNDFSYCLVHLLDKDRDYFNFYLDEINIHNRIVFLDNSVFEKGVSYPTSSILNAVRTLQPTYVIAPDVLHDGVKTRQQFDDFIDKFLQSWTLNPNTHIIAVPQGKTEEDYFLCYEYLSSHPHVHTIGVPYDVKFYLNELSDVQSFTLKYVFSRIKLINKLLDIGLVYKNKPHHLLGCSSPIEFLSYKKEQYSFINSVDTSCPIILTMFDKKLSYEGLPGEKIPSLLADNLDFKFDLSNEQTKSLLYHNLDMFKFFVQGEENVS